RKALKLSPVKIALLQEFARPPQPRGALVRNLKALNVPYTGCAPLDQAISVAGGVRQDALTKGFMLNAKPGVFCAGEMLDWEAPTGGYLLTACLATGRMAGQAAADYLEQNDPKRAASG
ncbi:MAG: aminoacetone oxidase family FAD-binding enzyme, partial [Rhodobacteraceae bacterium]|nr:aminoacetone oxidase family FAD-binding enzyme [Paracoccaceae bacterium]